MEGRRRQRVAFALNRRGAVSETQPFRAARSALSVALLDGTGPVLERGPGLRGRDGPVHELIPLPAGMREALRLAYSTPPRAYHHFGHIEAVLAQFEAVAAGPGWARPREAWLAVLYHDAVYEAGRRDNETRSAALAVDAIARWLPDSV